MTITELIEDLHRCLAEGADPALPVRDEAGQEVTTIDYDSNSVELCTEGEWR